MVIVAGHLIVEPANRDAYLAGCVEVVTRARNAAGCPDFVVSADHVATARPWGEPGPQRSQ
jgi:quinol monooxygenase YgiN